MAVIVQLQAQIQALEWVILVTISHLTIINIKITITKEKRRCEGGKEEEGGRKKKKHKQLKTFFIYYFIF